ncbi:hypothetical protein FHT02_002535 [Sphingomonas xinjiangensis]|uniref:TniQ domain-containing protein n=2 Tax=Sphingomonas xinjiangensis TaxID=643568 RepID=A0A840YQK4_9SPHN|nr:hypothetical protein [Sphingomonas xinjiangensis]
MIGVRGLNFAREVSLGRCLDILSSLSGADRTSLEASSISLSDKGFHLGSIQLSSDSISGALFGRVCPRCLEEDLDSKEGPDLCRPFRRGFWDVPHLVICPIHSVALTNCCNSCKVGGNRRQIDPRRCGAGHLIQPGATATASLSGQNYLFRRLSGEPGGGGRFLDDLPVNDAGRVMQAVGRSRLFGREWSAVERCTVDDLVAASSAGFETLANWPNELWHLLDELRERNSGGSKGGPERVYGSLTRWLQHGGGSQFPALASELANHYSATGAKTRHPLISDVQQSAVTVWSLALETGFARERIEQVAAGLGATVIRAHGPPRVSVEEAQRVRALLSRAVKAPAAAARLGLTLDTFKQLRREKILLPISGLVVPLYDVEVLDQLIIECSRGAPSTVEPPPNTLPLVRASRATNRPLHRVVTAILGGDLRPAARLQGSVGFGSILIDVTAVFATPYR